MTAAVCFARSRGRRGARPAPRVARLAQLGRPPAIPRGAGDPAAAGMAGAGRRARRRRGRHRSRRRHAPAWCSESWPGCWPPAPHGAACAARRRRRAGCRSEAPGSCSPPACGPACRAVVGVRAVAARLPAPASAQLERVADLLLLGAHPAAAWTAAEGLPGAAGLVRAARRSATSGAGLADVAAAAAQRGTRRSGRRRRGGRAAGRGGGRRPVGPVLPARVPGPRRGPGCDRAGPGAAGPVVSRARRL